MKLLTRMNTFQEHAVIGVAGPLSQLEQDFGSFELHKEAATPSNTEVHGSRGCRCKAGNFCCPSFNDMAGEELAYQTFFPDSQVPAEKQTHNPQT